MIVYDILNMSNVIESINTAAMQKTGLKRWTWCVKDAVMAGDLTDRGRWA